MVFSSSIFLFIYLPIVLFGYFFLRTEYRNFFLCLASIAFYAYGEPKFVYVLLCSILLNYIAAILVDFANNKLFRSGILIVTILINLSILFVFKYLNFFIKNINLLFSCSLPQTNILLPIGISFFTFQALSYVVDVYKNESHVEKDPVNVALYIALFPQLIAGPIVRYNTIAKEISCRQISWDDFAVGVERFLQGLSKKVLLANNLAMVADATFAVATNKLSVCQAWIGAVAYSLQIYYDFSGYSDMAIGLGRMFGFHFLENFNFPYISKSITEFWRRWHISLSTWFRDYVYIPLGGSRVDSTPRHILNIFVVWLLTGIWHGASWNFVVWGMIYFVLLIVEKYVIRPQNFEASSMKSHLWQVVTLLCVALSWVIFRAVTLSYGIKYICAMFKLQNNKFCDAHAIFYAREYIVVFFVAILFSTPLSKILLGHNENRARIYSAIKPIIYILLFLVVVSYLVMGAHNPFIYFNF